MSPKQFSKLVLSILRRPRHTRQALRSSAIDATEPRATCIQRACEWLLECQRCAPDGEGFSRRYSLFRGWDNCYIETSGYIIPTLLDASRMLGNSEYSDSAIRAGNWLLSVQHDNGSFTDIDSWVPQVFDTGQVLIGLNRLYRETSDTRFLDGISRAARWLVTTQDIDGAWRKHAFNSRPHAYYSRVGATLIDAGIICENQEFVTAGRRNLSWVLEQERANGYFNHSSFRSDEDAFLHTLVYVIEGFSMAFDLLREEIFKDALVRAAIKLLQLRNSDGLLHSQYDSNWHVTNREYCVTGLAQLAGICFDVNGASPDAGIVEAGTKILDRLCSWQLHGDSAIDGALPSSVPLWGYYGGMEFFNWNAKFFVDALIKESKIVVIDE